MKRGLSILLLVLMIFSACSKEKRVAGSWECKSYELYSTMDKDWNKQPKAFSDLFQMEFYEDGKVLVSASGQGSEGTYSFHGDTLIIDIRGSKSQYLFERKTLSLVNHPRARIVYTKKVKK